MNIRVLVVEVKYQDQIGHIRAVEGWSACRRDELIWLKGPLDNKHNQVLIDSLPILASYKLNGQNRLFPDGKLTPVALLNAMEWKTLPEFMPLEMPVSAIPAQQTPLMPVNLVRNQNPQPAYALQTNFMAWKKYVDGAPQIRLQHLKFVVSTAQEVFIIGDPLPPIPGKSFWLNGSLLVSAGYNFDPPFLASLLNQKLKPITPSYILFNKNGKQNSIAIDLFKPADRAVVRQVSF
ncbi:hypothetical protein EZ456_00875 [Pedobacter psychrodurus]|uniref:MoxR-vWA-beta-propeller ternary system domain-containing protein n=1 Tax=Pedobacter psychrodurus TaxID=2530456 RepID=A0A4R0QBD3_9SPHI|nr:hypothetical protein [Pedobacter psychrodurus]TCD29601.1 hypothetical protein EZ456_00875 [Pedobacter psychrodurus]